MPTNKKKNDEEEPQSSTKLYDVTKPGKTAPSATSRPVIVGHGSTLTQDPMVNPSSDKVEVKKTDDAPLQPRHNTVISPLEHSNEEIKAEASPAADDKESEKPEDTEAKAPESSSSAMVDAVANDALSKKEDKKDTSEDANRILELEKIIASKQYFVPIGEAKRHRTNQHILTAFIVLIILGAAGINFAIDAGMLDLGIKPFTDIL